MSLSGIWDGFDDYNATGERWDVASGTIQYSSAYARFSAAPNCQAQAVRFPTGGGGFKTKNYTSNVNAPIVSCAFLFEGLPNAGSQDFLAFLDGGSYQVSLALNANGSIEVWRGGAFALGTKIASSAPGVVVPNTWYFLDFVPTIGSSATVNVYLSTPAGGAALISASGVNTQNTANAYANQVSIGYVNGGAAGVTAIRFDDFHAHDAGGSAPTTALGEGTRIFTKMPSGAGYATTWTPNGAAANWQCVDEVPPDGDTTYVSAASFPLTEGYAIGAAGFTGTVNGVVRLSYIRKDDAGAHTFSNGVRSSTTNGLSTAVAVNSTYSWVQSFFATDPATSSAWTATGADAAAPVISAAS